MNFTPEMYAKIMAQLLAHRDLLSAALATHPDKEAAALLAVKLRNHTLDHLLARTVPDIALSEYAEEVRSILSQANIQIEEE